jgi:hypothetical protein
MKSTNIFFWIFIVITIAFFVLSCNNSGDNDTALQTETFWAWDFKTNRYYRVTADLLAQGLHSNIWVERGSRVTVEEAILVATAYDNDIHNQLIEAFDQIFEDDEGNIFTSMQFADGMSRTPNGRLCILFLDIKDFYLPGINPSYVAGYFDPLNFFNQDNSNRRDMIYIDIYPGPPPGSKESNMIIAHEVQHLMNFVSSILFRWDGVNPYIDEFLMDLWIDEGLSGAAEFIYAGAHNLERVEWFNTNGDGQGQINQGNNFFVWGNRNAVLDDYATVYLFFQWLVLQTDKTIYGDIITSNQTNHDAVLSAFNRSVSGSPLDYRSVSGSPLDWGTLLRDWLAANFINSDSGRFGYRNDPVLGRSGSKPVQAPLPTVISSSVDLFPGEGVFSRLNGSFTPSVTGDIRHASLSTTGVTGSFTAAPGHTLLTYNVNTDNKALPTDGTTTGQVPIRTNLQMSISGSFSAQSNRSTLSGPFRISGGDLLRRRGHLDAASDLDISKILRGAKIAE